MGLLTEDEGGSAVPADEVTKDGAGNWIEKNSSSSST